MKLDWILKLAAIILVPIIAFKGVIAILPYSWTHDITGELSGFGFWLVFIILFVLVATIHHMSSEKSSNQEDGE